MRSLGSLLVLLLALAVLAVPGRALQEPAAEEAEQNRRLLDKWRRDPEHYARLNDSLRAFQSLPPERQAQLRQLDHDLNEKDSTTRARLGRVMERYALWLESLPEAERKKITAAEPRIRLKLIRELREKQWLERLSPDERELVLKTPAGDQREKKKREMRQQERERRHEWLVTARFLGELSKPNPHLPAKIDDFPAVVRNFYNDYLQHFLSKDEEESLKNAEGQWPLYPRLLVELADKHPILLPGPTGTEPGVLLRFADLPPEVRQRFEQLEPAASKYLHGVEGKWPDFALAVGDVAKRKDIPLSNNLLGPSHPREFAGKTGSFYIKRLENSLDKDEKERLRRAVGQWPLYPRTLLLLGHKHHLTWHGNGVYLTLPGPRQHWDWYRDKPSAGKEPLPDLPDKTLRDFALTELTAKERSDLHLIFADPLSQERLKELYFERNPHELELLRQSDRRKK